MLGLRSSAPKRSTEVISRQVSKPPTSTWYSDHHAHIEPMPPRTTIARMLADSMKVKLSGR